MRLLPAWKKIVRRAWSIRLALAGAVFAAAEAILPMFSDVLPRSLFAALSFVAIVGAAVSRVVAQKDFDNDR